MLAKNNGIKSPIRVDRNRIKLKIKYLNAAIIGFTQSPTCRFDLRLHHDKYQIPV